MKRSEKISEGMLVAMTEYEQAFRTAGIPIEDRLEDAQEDFERFVLGWMPVRLPLNEYLDRVRANAKEYAGYAVQATLHSQAA